MFFPFPFLKERTSDSDPTGPPEPIEPKIVRIREIDDDTNSQIQDENSFQEQEQNVSESSVTIQERNLPNFENNEIINFDVQQTVTQIESGQKEMWSPTGPSKPKLIEDPELGHTHTHLPLYGASPLGGKCVFNNYNTREPPSPY